jgi:hypothetical protein
MNQPLPGAANRYRPRCCVARRGYHPFDPTGEADNALMQKRIMNEDPDFDDEVWDQISPEAKGLIRALLHVDPARRLTIEQLLQEPWLNRAVSNEPLQLSEKRLRSFKEATAPLRAAAFATLLKRQHTHDEAGNGRTSKQEGDEPRGRMLEADMLASAFRVFDPEGKGFITESACARGAARFAPRRSRRRTSTRASRVAADLGRVLSDLGKGSSANELHETLQEAARADREGKRVLYGDFVELMSAHARSARWRPSHEHGRASLTRASMSCRLRRPDEQETVRQG